MKNICKLFIIICGIQFATTKVVYANDDEDSHPGLVEVEPLNVLPSDISGENALVPYIVRRKNTANFVSLTYSLYNPVNYNSDYDVVDGTSFKKLYGSSSMLELAYNYKWNILLGSISAELGVGIYSNDNDQPDLLGNANLDLKVIRLGARYIMDAFGDEPFVAPYIIGGAYTVLYRESQDNTAYNGTTQAAPYYGAGVLFQLNWFDQNASAEGYLESGIENTYIFAEGRQYIKSTNETDPNFSTGIDINGGVAIEF